MKKIIYYLFISVFAFTACEEQDNIERYDLGAEFFVSNHGMTSLDDNVTFSVNNISKNLSELNVKCISSGKDLGSLTLTDGIGSATYSGSDLGVSEIEDAAKLEFAGSIDGKSIIRNGSVEVSDPISFDELDVLHKNTMYYLIYTVAPVSATVASVKVETKVGENGTYIPATPINGELDDHGQDSIAISGLAYNVGDSIFVKLTANTATKTAVSEYVIVVAPDSYSNVTEFTMDDLYNIATSDSLAFDLIKGEPVISAEAGDSADIAMRVVKSEDPDKILDIGFGSMNNVELVKSDADTYAIADKYDIQHTDFSSAEKGTEAVAGDYFVYRTKRGSEDYVYGVLKVVSVNEQVDISKCTITIEYKH